ncbi:hypothetical protein M0P65_07115 [Candidatus Gracilibacteria bacterium]|jgi:hypothetical protein|nr:hypothetical protein [Candidatus Gracilibacteria bacterium]
MKILKYSRLNNKFIVKFADIYYPIKVDNEIIAVKNNEEVVFEKLPTEAYTIRENKIPTKYKNISGDLLSVDCYHEQLSTLKALGQVGEEGLYFSDIDNEYKYKKFIRDWQPEYEIRIEPIEKIEFEEVKILQVEDKFILPMRFLGDEITNPLCLLRVDLLELITESSTKYGFTKVEDQSFSNNTKGFHWSVPRHSGWEYLKINDTYAKWNENEKNENFQLKGTHEECLTKLNHLKSILDKQFEKQKLILEDTKISKNTAKNLLNRIEEIKSFTYKIEVNKKTYADYTKLKTKVNELENLLIDDLKTEKS